MNKRIKIIIVGLLIGIILTGLSYFFSVPSNQNYECVVGGGSGVMDELGIKTEKGMLHGLPFGYYESSPGDCDEIISADAQNDNGFAIQFFILDILIWIALSVGVGLYLLRRKGYKK